MQEVLAQCAAARPSFPVIANVTAQPYPGDADAIRNTLVAQMVSPVLWADSMARLLQDGLRVFVEAGPGKVLAGLMRDINREASVIGAVAPDERSKLRAQLA